MNKQVPARRAVAAVHQGIPASDGAGVKLSRIMGSPSFNQLDPFLLLDVFRSDESADYIAGFPPHPHRGFETVTYMFAGKMQHQDSAGHTGMIGPGGVQWMTAARGIVHSEMPQQEQGLMWGVQLWVNLPADLKMSEPAYREYSEAAIPTEQREDGVRLKVIAGQTAKGTIGPVKGVVTEPMYFDVTLAADREYTEQVPDSHSIIVLVVEGAITIAGNDSRVISAGELAEFETVNEDGLSHQVLISSQAEESRVLLIAAKRLKEPVARGGPFVMNTKQEILQAFQDYNAGKF